MWGKRLRSRFYVATWFKGRFQRLVSLVNGERMTALPALVPGTAKNTSNVLRVSGSFVVYYKALLLKNG